MSVTAHQTEAEQVLDPQDVSKLAALAYGSLRHEDQQWNRLISGMGSDLAKRVARALLSDEPAGDKRVREIADQIRHWARKSKPAAGR